MRTTVAGFALCLACQATGSGMNAMICHLLTAMVLTGQIRQETRAAAETIPVAALPPALRIAAEKLASGHVSPLFEALGKRDGHDSAVGLSKMQLELIHRMDADGREILRHWLTRVRPKDSTAPSAEDLELAKAFVVGHLEAIVFEGVLTPRQSDEWRKLAMKPATPRRQGRYTLIPELFPPDSPNPETRYGYTSEIDKLVTNLDFWGRFGGGSDVFRVIFYEGFLLYTNERKVRGDLPDLSAQQTGLAKRLDAIARDSQRIWLLRGIDGWDRRLHWYELSPSQRELPPTPVMISRLSESGQRLRASLASHAEEILLEVVLDPAQRIELKRRLWTKLGGRSLLDPELASTLKLAKWQIQSISLMLEDRAVFWKNSLLTWIQDLDRSSQAKDRGAIDDKQVQKRSDEARRSHDQRLADFDVRIWDVLSTSQSRTLAKILGKPVAKKPAAKTKKAARAG